MASPVASLTRLRNAIWLMLSGGRTMMNPFKRVLCPIDLGPNSQRLLEFARKLVDSDAALVLFHVVPMPIEAVGQPIFIEPLSGSEHEAREALKKHAAEVSVTNAEIAVLTGEPAAEIIRAAADRKCDLIVIATHGRSGLTHFLLGSVAERVVRESLVPVLTVRCTS
jgi:nucleotide-binding universal stress UspA family protein